MEEVRTFLTSSTIHGLTYIGISNRCIVKAFWIFVVITGFIISALMICQSFKVWSENPVTTTVETRPITEIKFPKVTVCPPKNTFTDLNYDLVALENITLNPFAALGRLTDQNIDKHLYIYSKSGINLIIMERQP